jgi:type II secretory pathway component GspD/PulD (secretin)
MSTHFSTLPGFVLLFAAVVPAVQAKDPDRGTKQPDAQVMLEVRVVTISESAFERTGIDFEAVKSGDSAVQPPARPTELPALSRVLDMARGCAFLDDRQVRQLMENAQGDRRCNVMLAPRLMLLNGQVGTVDATAAQFFMTEVSVDGVGDNCIIRPKNEPVKLGFRMSARPVVSADGRSVQLGLKINYTELATNTVPVVPVELRIPGKKTDANPTAEKSDMTFFLQQPTFGTLAIDSTVCVANGHTAAFAGNKRIVEGRHEFGPPLLSKIPYVNRMVKTVGYSKEAETLLVLVTPRIVNPAAAAANVQQAGFAVARSPVSKPAAPVKCAAGRKINILAELLKAYDEACAAGRTEEAERLARAALILNPACFERRQ